MTFNIFAIMLVLNITVSLIGYLIGTIINCKNKLIISALYEISAGMMTGIVCFEMLPNSIEISNIYITIIGLIVGIIFTLILEYAITKIKLKNTIKVYKTSIILVILSMTTHNIIEGISIGSSYAYMFSLGLSLFISNLFHDIPESIVVGISLNEKKISKKKKIIQAVLLGVPTSFGIIIGSCIGNISYIYIALSLSISSGCMLYIVSCDLIPSSKEIGTNKLISIFYILGIILGLLITI